MSGSLCSVELTEGAPLLLECLIGTLPSSSLAKSAEVGLISSFAAEYKESDSVPVPRRFCDREFYLLSSNKATNCAFMCCNLDLSAICADFKLESSI